MLNIDRYSQTPIYEQIINGIEQLVLIGVMPPGSLLPSVRALSQELSVNPNTLQKAYAELERRGISSAVPGTGRFISENALEALRSGAYGILSELSSAAARLALSGVKLDTIISHIESAYHAALKQEGEIK